MPANADLPNSSLIRSGRFLEWKGEVGMVKGISYGPFAPRPDGIMLPSPDQFRRDLALMASWDCRLLRLFTMPDQAFLDACQENGIGVMLTLPLTDYLDFLTSPEQRSATLAEIKEAAARFAGHPALCCLLVGNEIRAELVRWSGPTPMRRFLEEAIEIVREVCPGRLVGYASFPSTEYLLPANADFMGVNLYLEKQSNYQSYLARLQALAGDLPLVLTEFGTLYKPDAPDEQATIWRWALDGALKSGVAAMVGFSFTDEWWRGGPITDWPFGLTDHARNPRPATKAFAEAPTRCPVPPDPPRFSVLVCSRNGSRTLRHCLEGLAQLRWQAYEIIVVDDGSTDETPAIAAGFPQVRLIRQAPSGLSVARNTAAAAATGDIFVYTDDDCVPEEDWLIRLAWLFHDSRWAAGGGPNIPPPPRNATEAIVGAAPGGPTHVLIDEEEAEHIPGCNFAVRREAFEAIGGFNPVFHAAGDDVDFCWRLRDAGYRIGFQAAAMVWHYRRFRVRDYYKQQGGYGKAESLLVSAHPERFGWIGGARWRGHIYGGTDGWNFQGGFIYQGVFGLAPYQLIYPRPSTNIALITGSFAWRVAAMALLAAGLLHPLLALPSLFMILISLAPVALRAYQSRLEKPAQGFWHRLLLFSLAATAPAYRAFRRYRGLWETGAIPIGPSLSDQEEWDDAPQPLRYRHTGNTLSFWSHRGVNRHQLLAQILKELPQDGLKPEVSQWSLEDFSIAMPGGAVGWLSLTEYHKEGATLVKVKLSTPFDRWRFLRWLGWVPGPWWPFTFLWWWQARKLARVTRESARVIGLQEIR